MRVALICLATLVPIFATAQTSSSTATYNLKKIGRDDISLLTTLTVNLNSSSTGTVPFISVTGTVTLGGTFVLNASGAPFPPRRTYLLIDNDGVDPIIGTFDGLPQGSIITSGGQAFSLSYVGNSGNDLVLTALASSAIPTLDPTLLVALTIMLAVIALAAIRR